MYTSTHTHTNRWGRMNETRARHISLWCVCVFFFSVRMFGYRNVKRTGKMLLQYIYSMIMVSNFDVVAFFIHSWCAFFAIIHKNCCINLVFLKLPRTHIATNLMNMRLRINWLSLPNHHQHSSRMVKGDSVRNRKRFLFVFNSSRSHGFAVLHGSDWLLIEIVLFRNSVKKKNHKQTKNCSGKEEIRTHHIRNSKWQWASERQKWYKYASG